MNKSNRFENRMEKYAAEGEHHADEIVSPQIQTSNTLPLKSNKKISTTIAVSADLVKILTILKSKYSVNKSQMIEPLIIEFLKTNQQIRELCKQDQELREIIDKL